MIVLSNKSHSQKCSHRQESKLCCVKMSYINATPNILLYIVPIKEVIMKNPFVGMVILVHLSLVRRPYNLMPMIGNSFSFTALLNYFLLLLLLCKEVGLAEDKNFIFAIGYEHFFSFRTIVNFSGDWKCPKHFFVGKKNILRNVHFWCNICTKDFLIKMDYLEVAL